MLFFAGGGTLGGVGLELAGTRKAPPPAECLEVFEQLQQTTKDFAQYVQACGCDPEQIEP